MDVFNASIAGWAQWTGTFTTTGTVRFAVRYYTTDGGPTGNESNYVGMDLFEVVSGDIIQVELTSLTANVNNNGDVILNWSTTTELK